MSKLDLSAEELRERLMAYFGPRTFGFVEEKTGEVMGVIFHSPDVIELGFSLVGAEIRIEGNRIGMRQGDSNLFFPYRGPGANETLAFYRMCDPRELLEKMRDIEISVNDDKIMLRGLYDTPEVLQNNLHDAGILSALSVNFICDREGIPVAMEIPEDLMGDPSLFESMHGRPPEEKTTFRFEFEIEYRRA